MLILAFIAGLLRVTDEDSLSQLAQNGPLFLLNVFTAFKGTNFYIFILMLRQKSAPSRLIYTIRDMQRNILNARI